MVEREYLVREVKVETLRRIVVECDKDSIPARKDRLISFAGSEWGTEKRKVLEYLQQLVLEESIMIENNDVWTFKRWLKILKAREKDYLHIEEILSLKFLKRFLQYYISFQNIHKKSLHQLNLNLYQIH